MSAHATPTTRVDAPARRFGGVTRLYGEAGAERLRAARVVVVGIGGVGTWAAEALARSAVGQLTLIDMDVIAESNTNRQIHALGDCYGAAKVQAMARRIDAINPECLVRSVDDFLSADNAAALLAGHDFVLDCIDQVTAKAAMIAHARAIGLPVVTCGAAGGRVDPLRIDRGDLGSIAGDPLLARVRHRLRRDHGFPGAAVGRAGRFHVTAVYSDEPVQRPAGGLGSAAAPAAGLACSGYGSSVAVTATMGFVAAAVALNALAAAGSNAG